MRFDFVSSGADVSYDTHEQHLCYVLAIGGVCVPIGMKKQLKHSESQEEAALVIQKHYRGYQIRNKINSPNDGQLDAASRKLLKTVCNKWKGKSIYQIILLDRANKLQDVVYFSLQVHMYNQHVICDLNNMNHRPVVLGNVMSTTNINEFLGSKKCFSYKIPFRLNQMVQNIAMDENITNSDVDDCNWDSPLNRLPEARTAFKILKHSFAVRDQGVQVGGVSNTNYNDSLSDQRSVQDNKRTYDYHEEKPIVKQRAVDKRICDTKEKNFTATTYKPPNRSNPVLELQLKGKQYPQSDNKDSDDPPYNFQAILKKTNYKRPSLEGRSELYKSETSGTTTRAENAYGGQRVPDGAKGPKDYKNELNRRLSKTRTVTELLPGVMLEGSCSDL